MLFTTFIVRTPFIGILTISCSQRSLLGPPLLGYQQCCSQRSLLGPQNYQLLLWKQLTTFSHRGGFGCLCRVQKYCILSNAPSGRAQLEHGCRGGRTSACRIQHTMFSKHGDHWGSISPQCSRRPKQILRAVSMYGNAQISERFVPTTSINTTTPKKDLRNCSNCEIRIYFSWNLNTEINISNWYVQVVQISISYWQNNSRK